MSCISLGPTMGVIIKSYNGMCIIHSYGIFYFLTSRIKSSKFLSPMKQIPILWKQTANSSSYFTSTFTLSSTMTDSLSDTRNLFRQVGVQLSCGYWESNSEPPYVRLDRCLDSEPSVWSTTVPFLYHILCRCSWFLTFSEVSTRF